MNEHVTLIDPGSEPDDSRSRLARVSDPAGQRPRLAKTTRPVVRDAMPRPRLFRRLDQVSARPVTWVWGPPGAGKTTLLASYVGARKIRGLWYHVDRGDEDLASFFYYLREAVPSRGRVLPLLTAEYLGGLETFARQFFRGLFAGYRSPFCVVLDNYQTVSSHAGLHEMLVTAAENLPPGGRLIVISREPPPPALARFTANRAMAVVDYEDVRLAEREARDLVKRLTPGPLSAAESKRLVGMANGWAGGLVLLASRGDGEATRIPRSQMAEPRPQALFDYFAQEVFASLSADDRQVLMQTAFLPRTTAGTAAALTRVPRAGDVLARLARRHYFTSVQADAEPVYQYHDLFREFLQARAREVLTPAERAGIQGRAGALLGGDGRVEAAASLFRDAEDWEGLAHLIECWAGELLGQGRSRTVGDWLTALPHGWVDEAPWLRYWRGMCRMVSDPELARQDFERALPEFRVRRDASGVFLTWSAAVESYVREGRHARPLDHWIALLEALMGEFPQFPSRLVEDQVVMSMFVSLMYRRPHHPEMAAWTQRALGVLQTSSALSPRVHAGLFLVVHHCWLGHVSRARQALDLVRAVADRKDLTPLAALPARAASAGYAFAAGETAECREVVEAAVRLSDASGVQVWTSHILCLGAAAALSCGDLDGAQRLLSQLAPRANPAQRLGFTFYQHLCAWRALLAGDREFAASTQEAAVAGAVELGMPTIEALWRNLLAQIRHARGETVEALAELARSLDLARNVGSRLAEWAGGLVEAQICLDRGEDAAGLATLARALAVGREHGLMNGWTWHPAAMVRLCATALAHGIEVDYVRALVRKRDLRVEPLGPLGLTSREAQVLGWVAEGKRDGEIAVILGISPRTVGHHLEKIYRKLNVETRTAAAALAVQAGATSH